MGHDIQIISSKTGYERMKNDIHIGNEIVFWIINHFQNGTILIVTKTNENIINIEKFNFVFIVRQVAV
jgi:hypothetical protein